MKDVKDFLNQYRNGNKLKDCVIDHYIEENDTFGSLETRLEDLQKYGCQSGDISELIYYDDTVKFYNDYRSEINELLANTIDGVGCTIESLFGDNYDKEDPLFLEEQNQNLLAWFGFEETTYQLYEEISDELSKLIEEENNKEMEV